MSENSALNLHTLFALQRQLLGQIVEGGEGSSLERLLKPRAKSGREIMAAALTGRMRADAAMFRQAEKNALEGKDIASYLKETSQGIRDALTTMRDLAAKVAGGTTATPEELEAYDEAAASIVSLVANAKYNGINLLDKTHWTDDERLTVNGNTARLSIQLGKAVRDITLHDYSDVAGSLPGAADLETAGSAEAVATRDTLEHLAENAATLASGFTALDAGFDAEAKAMSRQSKIAELAAARHILGARDDAAGKVLYYLLALHGKVIDTSS